MALERTPLAQTASGLAGARGGVRRIARRNPALECPSGLARQRAGLCLEAQGNPPVGPRPGLARDPREVGPAAGACAAAAADEPARVAPRASGAGARRRR